MLPFYFDDPLRWPTRPYCSDDPHSGLTVRPLAKAREKSYIQANPPHLQSWLLFDLDYCDSAFAWQDVNLPEPTWTTVNQVNGHAHLSYGLKTPVLRDGKGMREAPVRYASAIEAMMRQRLGADDGFAGLITKNPSHAEWRTLAGGHLYDLGELAEWLPGIEKFINRKKEIEDGFGRNVTIFNELRKWAYRNVRRYKSESDFDGWVNACNLRALDINVIFNPRLQEKEVWHIARSVSKWTWRRFSTRLSDMSFRDLQAHRGALGGEAKGAAYEEKRASARLMRVKGMTQQSIANLLGVHVNTVANWLRAP